jgi:arsenate reductase (thioredoxin)
MRNLVAEFVGTALLLTAVVGSGIMGEQLAGGNVAVALLANTLATGAALVALILTFGPISGAHFNPVVSFADASQGGLSWTAACAYAIAHLLGAVLGVGAADYMFEQPVFNAFADPSRADAVSAGTHPGDHVHPIVIEAMREVGLDVSANRPQRLTAELARTGSLLVTMGCGDECPYVPGLRRDDWPLSDPKSRPLEEVRSIRDEIRSRVEALIASRGWGKQG